MNVTVVISSVKISYTPSPSPPSSSRSSLHPGPPPPAENLVQPPRSPATLLHAVPHRVAAKARACALSRACGSSRRPRSIRRCNAAAAAAAVCRRSQLEAAGAGAAFSSASSDVLQPAAPNTSNALYFKRLHIARLLLRAVLQRMRFAPRPSRPLTRAAATELHHYHYLISPLAHPV